MAALTGNKASCLVTKRAGWEARTTCQAGSLSYFDCGVAALGALKSRAPQRITLCAAAVLVRELAFAHLAPGVFSPSQGERG